MGLNAGGLSEPDHRDGSFLAEIKHHSVVIAKEYEKRLNELNQLVVVMETHQELVNEHQRPQLFSQLAYGNRRAVEACAWALWLQRESYKKEKQARGLAWHENFFEYVKRQELLGNKVKETDTARNMYVEIDPAVVKAREGLAIAEALLEQFNGLKFEFIQGQASLKAMYFGNKDNGIFNSTASNSMFGES